MSTEQQSVNKLVFFFPRSHSCSPTMLLSEQQEVLTKHLIDMLQKMFER